MRIWDIQPSQLCDKHLLGEHRELHAIWSILTNNKKGYSKHPETIRWRGKLKALYKRHQKQREEMKKRGFQEKSPLDKKLATGGSTQNTKIDSIKKQKVILKNKNCNCKV